MIEQSAHKHRVFILLYVISLFIFCLFIGCKEQHDPSQSSDNEPPVRVFLIIIDALRADHLGCYGYERNTSPVIDSLAASGTLFSLCQSQAPWTLPSIATIWTGLTVQSHGSSIRDGVSHGVDQNLPVISTVLRDNGFITAGIVNNGLLTPDFGFDNGFDFYSYHNTNVDDGEITIFEALHWLQERKESSDPIFMAIHLFDVHAPYAPPPPFDTLFCEERLPELTDWLLSEQDGHVLNPEDRDILIAKYDGSISYTDTQIGLFLTGLRRLDMLDNSLFIITADHGEEFLDHGYIKHGPTLYQEVLHVPLIICGTGVRSGIIEETPVGLMDVFPTILGYLVLPRPDGVEGIDLFSSEIQLDRDLPSSGCELVMAGKFDYSSYDLDYYEHLASVLNSSRSKIIMDMRNTDGEMFNLFSDPSEMEPLTPDSSLIEAVEYYWLTPPSGSPLPILEETANQRLRDVGYF